LFEITQFTEKPADPVSLHCGGVMTPPYIWCGYGLDFKLQFEPQFRSRGPKDVGGSTQFVTNCQRALPAKLQFEPQFRSRGPKDVGGSTQCVTNSSALRAGAAPGCALDRPAGLVSAAIAPAGACMRATAQWAALSESYSPPNYFFTVQMRIPLQWSISCWRIWAVQPV